jgi:hypothetical protein
VIALAALAATVWTYADSRREIVRLATEVAQLRISLDLYAKRSAAPVADSSGDTTQLDDLSNRIAILEQAWRDGAGTSAPMPSATANSGAQPGAECLPSGMRILVAAGDRYPVCGHQAEVQVSGVDNGYITLSDGTAIPSGGTMALGNSGCMIGVTSGGDEGVTGYAEIRVTC